MTRVAVVTNPVCDPDGRVLDRVRGVCRERGWGAPLALSTSVAEPGLAQAGEAVATGAGLVLAVGGDGTVREVAAALAGTDTTLGIVPCGTANLLARNLRLPLGSVDRAVAVAVDGRGGPLDLVQVRLTRPSAQPVETTSLVISGLGYDGATMAAVRPGLKRALGWPAYLEPGLWRLWAPLLPMTVAIDDGPEEAHDVWSVLVGSCGRIPLGIQVLPGARLDDGVLDTAFVAPRHTGQWLSVALKTVLHLRREMPGLTARPGRQVRVTSPLPLTAQVDGDPFTGVTALEATVRPAALRVRRAS